MELKDIQIEAAGNGFPAELKRIRYKSGVDGVADWAMVLPPKEGMKWLVCIHGHGSLGDQLYTRQDIRDWYLPRFQARGYGILTPTLRGNAWMSPPAVDDLDGLLDLLRNEYKAEKFYFFGGSMGGTSNLTYACLRPQNVAGVVANGAATDLVSYISFCRKGQDKIPVLKDIADAIEKNYNGDTAVMRAHSALYNWQALKGKRIFYAQGTFDQLMPVADARRLAGAMAEERGFAYVEIPGGDHDSPLFIGLAENSSAFKPFDWMEGTASQS